ncbi:MAG TPA: GTP-binding protein, partial [Acidimicrobiales bacterium]|nr:GTP-binding protein [Acidimicrobiales bacterium]
VLVDARKGVVEQSRRHAVLASLLHVPHLVLCVNKMDLVGYDQDRFEEIRDDFESFCTRLEVEDLTSIPVSALHGDNVVGRSPNMEWYEGPSLLHHLEHVYIGSDRNLIDPRFPVQYVLRPHSTAFHDYRGYAGQVASGSFQPGHEVLVLPSGLSSVIEAIDSFDGPVEEAFPPMSVAIRLADDVDVSRGDMICRVHNRPTVGQDLDAMVAWMAETPMRVGGKYAIKHTSRAGRALVQALHYRLDVNTLHRDLDASTLSLNEIGRVGIRATVPLFYDEYRRNRATGSFILVDESNNNTVGAGMILERMH